MSPLCTKFSSCSIVCNIVAKDILQTQPRWRSGRAAVLTTLPYRPVTWLPHPNTTEYHENACVLPANIQRMNIHRSPQSISTSVWTFAAQPPNSESQIYQNVQIFIAAQIVCHAVTSNARTFTHHWYIWNSQMQGDIYSVRFSVIHLPGTKRKLMLWVLFWCG